MNEFLNLLETLANIAEYEESIKETPKKEIKDTKDTKDTKDITDSNDIEFIDLKTDEGLNKFNKSLDELEGYDLGIFDIFIDELRDLGTKLHNQLKEKDKKEKVQEEKKEEIKSNPIDRNLIDHSTGQDFTRPSELLSIDKKLTLHKIVQEYIDTMIKPYNHGTLTNDQINDAYAGLYEFGAWVLNK